MRYSTHVLDLLCKAALVVVSLTASLLAQSAFAQDTYPSHGVIVITPYASISSGTEPIIRTLLQGLSDKYGQQFVIEPRGGANGAIGMGAAAHAKPDGYTLLFTNISPTTVLPAVQKNVPFDAAKDFAPVFMIGRGESFIMAGPSMKSAKDMGEIFRIAKEKPGTVSYAVVGAAQRLNVAMLESLTGAKFLVVPYPGTGQAATALMGGIVDLAVDTGDVKALSRGGVVRVVATNNAQRTKEHPDIPASAEFAPGFESRAWHGILGPAGMPRDRIDQLHRDLTALVAQPKMRELMQRYGLEPAPMSTEEFGAIIQRDLRNNINLAKQFNIVVD
ncbi:MAG TPA: tripartite tricarboxylate transporter substrate binding protein [Burkholderiales bacterium]|nr:tripartite tricarboxylate transporter substrate binding protein [Burkholderiales bacterium]